MKDELLRLAALCERATGLDREIDERVGMAIGMKRTMRVGHEILGTDRVVPVLCPRFTYSIDAALTLVPERYAWGAGLVTNGAEIEGWAWCGPNVGPYAFAATPALAICAAALRARASMEQPHD